MRGKSEEEKSKIIERNDDGQDDVQKYTAAEREREKHRVEKRIKRILKM